MGLIKPGIQIPEELHEEVTKASNKLGIPIQRIYWEGARLWLAAHAGEEVGEITRRQGGLIDTMLRMFREDAKGDLATYITQGIKHWARRHPKPGD